jgi:small-conductance mechanosensitive channel
LQAGKEYGVSFMAMDIQEFLQSLWSWLVQFLSTFPENYILPNLQLIIQVGALLVVAYVLGKIGKAVTVKLLSIAGLKKVTIRSWTDDILKAVGYRGNIVSLIGDMVKWFIYIMFLGLVIETLGFPGLLNIFTQIAVFVPKFIVAILIIVVGFLIADFMGKVFEEAGRRLFAEETISVISGSLIKYTIALASIVMALGLVGLDAMALNIILAILLTATVAILILAIRDTLSDFTAGLYLRRSLKHGEFVKVGGHRGLVERIDEISVTLKDGERRIVLPNSLLVKTPFERHGKRKR